MTKTTHPSPVTIIGHRGAKGLAPENTIASLKAGLAAGADGLEMDVHVTKDGQVVLHHNPIVQDQTGEKAVIATTAYDTLKKLKGDIPTLASAIKQVGRTAPMMIEIKKGVPVGPVLKVLTSFIKKGWTHEDFIVGSKDFSILTALHELEPKFPLIVIDAWSGVRASRRARKLNTKYISMNQLFMWWGFIRGMRSGGYRLFVYTLNSPRKARYWAQHGLYGVITDYPDRFTTHTS